MTNPVNFVYNGKLYSLSEAEIEAAYRYRKLQYATQDVLAHWEDENYDINEELSEDDACVIAESALRIMDKSDNYMESYWSCINDAIKDYNDGVNMR